jgi:hypothetical protein
MKHHYFIAFLTPNGNGNTDVWIDSLINEFNTIKTIQKAIEKKYSIKGVVITNFILLSKTKG